MKIKGMMRSLLFFLVAVMVLSLFACGGKDEKSTTDSGTETNIDSNTDNSGSDSEKETADTGNDTKPESDPETDSASEGSVIEESGDITESLEGNTTESAEDDSETDSTSDESGSVESGDTTESTEPEAVETESGIDIVSFVDYRGESARSTADLKEGPVAVSFTVPEGGYLKEFYLNLTNEAKYTACAITVNMYSFNGNYDESVATEPVYSKVITSTLKSTTLKFDDKKFGAGEYLLVVSCTEEVENGSAYTSVMVDSVWKGINVPEKYLEYEIKSYINGRQKNSAILCCAMAVERNIPVIKAEEDETPNTEKDDENVAKVILLAGQSNAAGVSQTSILQTKISAEEFAKYQNGFPNVKIIYKNGNADTMMNVKEEFVDVKLGQGIDAGAFGPEIGLAAYLSEAYPDETFYIIKYGVGGTNLLAHWNATDTDRDVHLEGFKSTIDQGLGLIKDSGLTPKIIGWLWMQGESDSVQFYHAHEYYNREKALVEHIRSTYADYASASGIKFIDAATGNSGFFASWFLVNDMKLKYSKENLDNYYIDTISYGLTTLEENNDLAHYDSMSMIILGRLFGDKLAYALDGDKDDEICPHKESGLKEDKDVHYTECEICKVRFSSEAHVLSGAVEYDADTKSYKGSCACGACVYSDLYYETEARSSTASCDAVSITTGNDKDEGYFVRYTPTANKRARIFIIHGNTTVTGQYLILKYRLVNNGNNSELKDTFVATTASGNVMPRENGDKCGTLGTLIGDGEWHYMVVDLEAKNKATDNAGKDLKFIADANGKYACAYIRADFVLKAYDGSCYLDIASVGFADHYDAASKFIEACPHTEKGSLTYDAATKSYKRPCTRCGEAVETQDLLCVMEARSTTGGCDSVSITTGNDESEAYFVRYTPTADKRARIFIIHGNTVVTGQYLVLKYRLVNNNANADLKDAFAATTASANTTANGKGDVCGNLGTLIGDGEWHYLVVDLAAKNAGADNGENELQFKAGKNGVYACAYIRADFVLQTYDESCYLDIASVGFADNIGATEKFYEECPHTSRKNFVAKAPTCSEAGNEAYSKCNGCGVMFDSNNEKIDAIPTLPTSGHTAKGEIVYNGETKLYEDNCTACGAAVSTQELLTYLEGRVATGACENLEVTTKTEDGDDFVRYTQTADARVRFYIIHGNTVVTGQYLVLKYRLVNNNTDTVLKDAFAATTASANATANGNGDVCGNLGTLIGDGEWHYLVVDLAAKNAEADNGENELQFKADENGKYACSYIRADFLLEAYDGSCYLDIASVGFADQKDVADKVANTCYHFGKTAFEAKAATCTEGGNEAYSICKECEAIFNADNEIIEAIPTLSAKGHSKILEYVEAEQKCNEKCAECGMAFGSYSILHTAEGRTSLGACHNLAVSTGTENGDSYVRYTQNANARVQFYPIFGNAAITGQYLVLKYRLVNNNKDTDLYGAFAATTVSSNGLAAGNGDGCGTLGTLIGDGEWHYLVVDLLAKNTAANATGADLQFKADANGNYACKYIRADFLLDAYDGSCYLDIASIGFAG